VSEVWASSKKVDAQTVPAYLNLTHATQPLTFSIVGNSAIGNRVKASKPGNKESLEEV
jgi:hypothetical protein